MEGGSVRSDTLSDYDMQSAQEVLTNKRQQEIVGVVILSME